MNACRNRVLRESRGRQGLVYQLVVFCMLNLLSLTRTLPSLSNSKFPLLLLTFNDTELLQFEVSSVKNRRGNVT